MRSFLRTNYSVRLNKGIERKLIFRTLSALADQFPVADYRYLGMGSMWFMDFILADRHLGIRKMSSFELDRTDANRARTNVPLAPIEVLSGDAGKHLKRIRIEKERSICWLDFDNAVDDDVLETLRNTAVRMRSGSVLIATVVGTKPPHSKETPREQWLRERFLDAVPATIPPRYFDDEDLSAYPKHLADLLQETLRDSVRISSGDRRYRPLFAFAYRDGQRMVSVGGIVVSERDAARLDASGAMRLPFVGADVTILEAPLLTAREKAAIDRLLPAPRIASRRARRAGVRLSASELSAYVKWFREYPLFAEVEFR